MTISSDIQALYIAYFNRPADYLGLKYWEGQVAANKGSVAAVANAFSASKEYTDQFAGKSTADIINTIYQNLFGRGAEPAAIEYWGKLYDNKVFNIGNIATSILTGAQNADKTTITNKVAAAEAFYAAMDTSAEIIGYDGAAANAIAKAWLVGITDKASLDAATTAAALNNVLANAAAAHNNTTGTTSTLTVNSDNLVGTNGNDTFNGYVNTTAASTTTTASAADIIDGGAGVDSLKLTVEGTAAGSLPAASISNVENFFIRDVATAASTYNFGSISGEAQVWADTATNAVTFADLGTGATVGVKGNNVLTTLGNVSFNMATATDAVSIAIDGGVKNALSISATAGTATAATISSTGAANSVGAVKLSGGTNTVTSLTVNAATNLTAALTASDFAGTAKLVVTGAGAVDLGANFDGDTIDASANTGGLTISTTATVTKSVIGSAAADSVTLVGALTATGKIDLGAGNDKLLTGAGASIGGTNVIDGGAGTDSISAALINAANAAAIKNFEILDLSNPAGTYSLDVELVTGSTISALALTGAGAGGAALTNVAAGVGLSVTGANTGATTIGVKGAATATTDAFTVTFAGAAAATAPGAANVTAGTVVLNGVENVTVASAGGANTWNSIALTDDKLKVVSITGAKDLDLTFVGVNGTNNGSGVGAVSSIDGSAATGKLSINTTNVTADGNGLTVKGGSAADTITLAQVATVIAGDGADTIVTSAFGGTLTGGAGNDKFNVAAAVATGATEATAALTTITDLAAGDSVKLLAGNVLAGATLGAKTALDATVTNIDLALAIAALTDTVNEVSWFQYGANTYIVANNGTAGFQAGDLVVKLTGLVDLTNATLDGATDYLTLA